MWKKGWINCGHKQMKNMKKYIFQDNWYSVIANHCLAKLSDLNSGKAFMYYMGPCQFSVFILGSASYLK